MSGDSPTDRVALAPGETHCFMCDGTGKVCQRCAYPYAECRCDPSFYCHTEECLMCDGSGIEQCLGEVA